MKIMRTLCAAMGLWMAVNAAGYVDHALLYELSQQARRIAADAQQTTASDSTAVIVSHDDGILSVERIALCDIAALSHREGIAGVYRGGHIRPLLDKALPICHVDEAHALGTGHGGKGVMVGIVDIGFDPHHGAFVDSAAGSRVCYLRNTRNDSSREAVTPSEIEAWTTDDVIEYHATHVMGIMAGGKAPYRGVAPQSDIAVATGIDSDADILASLEALIACARRRGQPIVINMSLGTSLGPHDGTHPFNIYVDSLARETPIILSAGNDGASDNVAIMQYTDTVTWQGPILQSMDWSGNHVGGYVQIWSADATPLDLSLRIYDDEQRQWVSTIASQWQRDDDGTLCWRRNIDDTYFHGSIEVYGSVAPYNGRYVLDIKVDVTSKARTTGQSWSRYWLGLMARPMGAAPEASRPLTVHAYADGDEIFFIHRDVEGSAEMSREMSISSLACGHNVTVVGSMVSRQHTPVFGNDTLHDWGSAEGTVSPWSSWATLEDGRRLPHVCAPGEYLVSAYSRPYVATHNFDPSYPEVAAYDGKDYWEALRGTSMSSPYVGGVYALWLADDPTLTPRQLRDRAMTTAMTDYGDIADPRWGAGCIDALAGHSGINDTTDDVDLTQPLAVYNLDGRRVAQHPTTPGVYIMTYRRADGTILNRKTIIR